MERKPSPKPEGIESDAQASMMQQLREVDPEIAKKGMPLKPVAEAARPPEKPVEQKSELAVLTGRCVWDTETEMWTDRFGKKHGIHVLDFGDLGEFERRHGELNKAFEDKDNQLNLMLTLTWLAIRKEGCSDDDLDHERFKYTRPAVGRMFGINDGAVLVRVAMNVLKASGMDIDVDDLGNQLEAGEEEEQAPAEDS